MEHISCLTQLFPSLQDWEKVVRKKTGGQGVSAWAPNQWMRKCSQTPKYHSGSCRAHRNWTCWDWSRNLSFPAGTCMAFVVTFPLSSSSQCPCEDPGQSQVPEDFPGTEVTIWICSAHTSVPLSHKHFGMYFMLPWIEQALTFFISLQIKGPLLQSTPFILHCFNFKWKFPLSQTVHNYHGKDFPISDHTISDLMILIRLCWEHDIYFKQLHYRGTDLTQPREKSGHFLGKMPYFNILISLCITNGSHYLALAKQRTKFVTNKVCLLPEGHGFHLWQHTQRSSGDRQVIQVHWVFISSSLSCTSSARWKCTGELPRICCPMFL